MVFFKFHDKCNWKAFNFTTGINQLKYEYTQYAADQILLLCTPCNKAPYAPYALDSKVYIYIYIYIYIYKEFGLNNWIISYVLIILHRIKNS